MERLIWTRHTIKKIQRLCPVSDNAVLFDLSTEYIWVSPPYHHMYQITSIYIQWHFLCEMQVYYII